MSLTITGKGDFNLFPQFKEGDFGNYELYLKVFDENVLQEVSSLPPHIKLVSIHTTTYVNINGMLHPFNLAAPGIIGEASLVSFRRTVDLAKQIGAKVVVMHGATYDKFNETKEKAMQRLASRVLPLLSDEVNLCFENDVLWHNVYYHRRTLMVEEEDFELLNNLLGGKLKITLDFEHLSVSYHFLRFVEIFGGELEFMKRYSEINQKAFEKDYQGFVNQNFEQLQAGLDAHMSSFFAKFNDKIEHLHINGSDPKSYFFNPQTALPLSGEHLPLGFNEEGVSDKLNYDLVRKLLLSLPQEKQISLVLEVWPRRREEFMKVSLESRDFLKNHVNENENVLEGNTMAEKVVKIGNHEIKNFGKPFVIAEVGSNHNGDIELGKKMIDAAVEAGADCVKFQAFDMQLFSSVCYEDDKRRDSTIDSHSALKKHLTETHKNSLKEEMEQHVASKEMLRAFKEYCDEKNVAFFCTPLNIGVTDFLVDELGMEFIKVASMDLNNLPFLEYLAKKNKPIILSTGMGTLQEIMDAVNTIVEAGNDQIVLLHCVSLYPPKDETVNLNNLEMLRNTFDFPIGFSDHTFGTSIPLAAVAKGASVIEKHFTLDKTLPGWDHKVSANPEEMKEIVEGSRRINLALGNYRRTVSQEELDKKALFGRSVILVRDMTQGEVVKEEDIDYRRPGTGIKPGHSKFVIGRTLKKDLKADDLVKFDDLV